MGADDALNEKLRGLAGVDLPSAFAVSRPDGIWLTVKDQEVAAARDRPRNVALVEADALRANGPSIARALADAPAIEAARDRRYLLYWIAELLAGAES